MHLESYNCIAINYKNKIVMKIKLVIALALIMGISISSADAQIKSGMRQKPRIENGRRYDELNRFEKQRLMKERQKIYRHKQNARLNDGRIGPRERRMLQHEKRKHHRHAYRYKHNRFERS